MDREVTITKLAALLAIAKTAAQAAAAVHRRAVPGRIQAGLKDSPMNLVTEVDREAAQVVEIQSSILPNLLLVAANPAISKALIEVLAESGAA